jgi:hypothetical protein
MTLYTLHYITLMVFAVLFGILLLREKLGVKRIEAVPQEVNIPEGQPPIFSIQLFHHDGLVRFNECFAL